MNTNNYCNNCWDEHTAGEYGCNCPCHTNNESWAASKFVLWYFGKPEYWGPHDKPRADAMQKELVSLIRSVEAAAEAKGRRDMLEERDSQVISWIKLPIEFTQEGKIGRLNCRMCGDGLVRIRGAYPRQSPRDVCATCAVETIENILENLYGKVESPKLPDVKEGI